MFFKTRTNFFPKYLSNKSQLIIHKNHVMQKVQMEQNTYKLLLEVLEYFRNGALLDLKDKEMEYKKVIKFLITNDLIQQPNQPQEMSGFIYDYIENAFDDIKPILRYVSSTHFVLINTPEYVADFFSEHQLLNDVMAEHHTQTIRWADKNRKLTDAQPGDLCVLHVNNNYALFFLKKQKDVEQAASILTNRTYHTHQFILGKSILPMKILIKLLQDNRDKEEIITIIDENGRTEEVSKGKPDDTLPNYERDFPKKNSLLNQLEFIKELERKVHFSPLNIEVNNEDGVFPVKLNVSAYEIKVNNNYTYYSFDYNYKSAAISALTYFWEEYLNSFSNDEGVWISERSKERFYIRGLASFLKVPGEFWELKKVPDDIQQKLSYIIKISPDIKNIKIVVQDILQYGVFDLYLLDQNNRILFKSKINVNLQEGIQQGLATITAYILNKIDFKPEYFESNTSKKDFHLTNYAEEDIYNNILEDAKFHNIYEIPWAYQGEFEQHGLYIGKFYKDGANQ